MVIQYLNRHILALCLCTLVFGNASGQTDDHGDTRASATPIEFNMPVEGRFDDRRDIDYFRLVIDVSTIDVDIFSSGPTDTEAIFSDGFASNDILNDEGGEGQNFRIRARLIQGTYYVRVRLGSFNASPGDYTITVQTYTNEPADEHGDTFATASSNRITTLPVQLPAIINLGDDIDYFRLELTIPLDAVIFTRSVDLISVRRFHSVYDSSFNLLTGGFDRSISIRNAVLYPLTPGTYYISVSAETPYAFGEYVLNIQKYVDSSITCPGVRDVDDPLYNCQWYLENNGQYNSRAAGEDINVASVWETYKGEGVHIAIVDDGMDFEHEDLAPNVDRSLQYSYSSGSVFEPTLHHGTAVSGIIAARDENGLGVRGVAPRATIYGYNLLALSTVFNQVDAIIRNMEITAVSSNSWGISAPFVQNSLDNFFLARALETGVNEGFNGKGIVYVFGAGNNALSGGSANYDFFTNHYAIVTVCAVSDLGVRSSYSEGGASLWVCAPSSETGGRHMTTTGNSNIFGAQYRTNFGGTSAAAPVVSGVVALVRQANPELSWRDVKLILAGSARKNHASDAGWEDGAVEYRSVTEHYEFNYNYGFGVVDAQAAVNLAQDWDNVPAMKIVNSASVSINQNIPDDVAITSLLPIDSDIDFIEFVEINVFFPHPRAGELDLRLISPSGAVSRLVFPHNALVAGVSGWRFGSAKHLGEDPNGIWKLSVIDTVANSRIGELVSWDLKIYGHSSSTPTVSIADTDVLTEENLDGSTLTLRLAGAIWSTSLSVADFNLMDIPAGISIADVTRNSGRTVTLTLAFNGTDFDMDYDLTVQTSATAIEGYANAPIISSNHLTIIANREATGKPSIIGIPQVSIPLTATMGSIADDDGLNFVIYAWQWQVSDDRNTWTDIPNADKEEFIPTAIHQDQFLRVVADFTDNNGFRESRISASVNTAVLAPPPLVIFVPERLTEETLDGATLILTLTEAVWNDSLMVADFILPTTPAGLSIANVMRNTDTSATLTLAFNGSDFDSNMTIGVTVLETAYSGNSSLGGRPLPIIANQEASGEPSIIGIQQVGIPLTATIGSITDGNGINPANYEWQWQLSNNKNTWTDIPNADTAEFIPALIHQDQFLRVVASFTDDDGFRESRTSGSAGPVAAPPSLFISVPTTLSGANLDDAKLTLNLTDTVWNSSLSAADFSLNSAPPGVRIADVTRDSDTTVTLTLAFNDLDFDIDYDLIVQVSAVSIAVYVGEPIINSNQITVFVNREASGAPRIIGTPRVGIQLTATMGNITDGNGLNGANYEWQWQVSDDGNTWTDIPGANTADFAYSLIHQYQFSRVVASFTDDHGYSESRGSIPVKIVLAPPRLFLSAPTALTGENLDGSTFILTLTDAVWSSPLSAADFRLDGNVFSILIDSIERNSDATVILTLRSSLITFSPNLNIAIRALATAVSGYIGESINSINYVTVLGNQGSHGLASIMGTPQVGIPLTATVGDIADGNGLNTASYAWQWQVYDENRWVNISGADTAEFIPALTHQGQSLRVLASFTDDDGFRESRNSRFVGPVAAPPPLLIAVPERLTEANLHGSTLILTLTEGVWNDSLMVDDFILPTTPAGLSIAEIERNTDTSATLTLAFDGTDFDSDMTIGVTASARAHSGTTDLVSRLIAVTANQEASGAPSIMGTPRVDFRLTATLGNITDGNGLNGAHYEWQWQVSDDGNTWTDIPNADTVEFIPALTHQGKFLRVVTSFTDDEGFRESLIRRLIGRVLEASPLLIFAPERLTEANLHGSTLVLTLTEAVWDDPLAVDGFILPTAPAGLSIAKVERNTDTSATLTLAFDSTDFDNDMTINITVSATVHNGSTDLVGQLITIVANQEASGAPSIIGTPRVGFRLAATIGDIADGNGLDAANYEWQWQVSNSGNRWMDIPGADTAGFIPAATHQGQFLRVVTSFTDDEGFRESLISIFIGVLAPPSLHIPDNRVTEIELSDPGRLVLAILPDVEWDNPLLVSNFRLLNAPTGLSIREVEYIDDNITFMYLEFDGTDFDNDIQMVIQVSAGAIREYVGAPLTEEVRVIANQEASGEPLIIGIPQVGFRLTATRGDITDGNGLVSAVYEWQWQVSADGSMWTDIPGADTAEFILAIAHQGQFLRVVASFTDRDGFQESRVSTATAAVLAPPMPLSLISVPTALTEVNLHGSTLILTLTKSTWSNSLSAVDFSLATTPTALVDLSIDRVERNTDTEASLTLAFGGADFDNDMAIGVTVLATAHSGSTDLESHLITITANDEASGAPSITGTPQVGIPLTATRGDITDGNGLNTANYEWQWQVSTDRNLWMDIESADMAVLIPLPAYQDQFLRVIASFTDDIGFQESRISIATATVLAPSLVTEPALPPLLISVPISLTEVNLDGSTLILTLTETTWSRTLSMDDFSLATTPTALVDLSIDRVERNTDTEASLTLAFGGADFDNDIAIGVTVLATAHSGSTNLESRLITITANDEAVGEPVIIGSAQVNVALTAIDGTIADGNGLVSVAYEWQWQVSDDGNLWTDIPGANTAAFIPVEAHQGQLLRVVANFADNDGFQESRISIATAAVLAPSLVTEPAPAMSPLRISVPERLTEVNLDGSTLILTLTESTWSNPLSMDDFSLATTLVGLSIDRVERNTDTTASLTLAFGGADFDNDMAIGVTVLATAHSGSTDLESHLITITANDEASGEPLIMGTPQVGNTLTATIGSVTDSDGLNTANYEWQWQVSADGSMWMDIPGANTAEFIPALIYQGQSLRVVASFTDRDGFRESRVSGFVGPVLEPPLLLISAPTALTEVNLHGSTLILTLTKAVWSSPLSAADFSLNTILSGVSIARVERSTDTVATLNLAFGRADFDNDIAIGVTALATAHSGTTDLVSKLITITANDEASGAPSITGTPQVGIPLTATIGDIADGNGINPANYEWQWQVSADGSMWTDIPGANTAEFIPVEAHQGQSLRVIASFTDDSGFQESRISIATAAVLAPPSVTVFTEEPLTELNLNGATLTLVITGASWEAPLQIADFSLDGMPLGIGIAAVERDTDTTARLIVSFDERDFDTDGAVTVQVSNTAIAEYVGAEITSTDVVDILANDEAVGEPVITGSAQVGVALTATIGDIADGNGLNSANYEWQWQVWADGSMWMDIPGANTAEFIPVIAHQGQLLRVVANFADNGGFRESRISIATAAVLAPPSVTVFTAEPLTELNLNGATLTLVITGASWEAPLQIADFSLVDAPLGVGISAVERDTDTTARLIVSFNGRDFDTNAVVTVQVSNTAIAEYVGADIISTNVVDIVANDEASGAPSITGTPQVGIPLTATIGDIADGNGINPANYEWQWQISANGSMWTDILGANTVEFIPAEAHQGQSLRVIASFTDNSGFQESRISIATAAVLAPPSVTVFTEEPLTELNLNGATLTLVITGASWEVPLQIAGFSLVDAPLGIGIAAIERDTDTTARLIVSFNGRDFDTNATVTVQVSNTAIAEYVGAEIISMGVVDILANDEASGEPVIIGVAQVGVALTATTGTITDGNGINSANYEWQWQVSADGSMWTDIPGANTAEFIPELTHQGQFLRVVASFTDDNGFQESRISIATAEVLASPSVTVFAEEPLTEINLNGATLTLVITGASWEATLQIADFSLGGMPLGIGISAVERDTDTTARLIISFDGRDFDTNAAVTVQVSNTAIAEYVGAEIISRVVDILANDEAIGEPVIIGSAQVGVALTATTGTITDGNGLNSANYEWQWQVSADGSMWMDIPGANTAEFIPAEAHQGQSLRVIANFTDRDGFRESRTSISVGPVSEAFLLLRLKVFLEGAQ